MGGTTRIYTNSLSSIRMCMEYSIFNKEFLLIVGGTYSNLKITINPQSLRSRKVTTP